MHEPEYTMTEFKEYMTTVITTGRLARPTAFGPNLAEHAQSLTEQLFKSFHERLDAFTAYERYMTYAKSLGVDTRDLQPEMTQVRAGLQQAAPNAVFSADLMRESLEMLERNTPLREVIFRTIQLQERSAAVNESRQQLDHPSSPITPLSREAQIRERSNDGFDQGRRR